MITVIIFADYKGIFHYTASGAVVEELSTGARQTALSNSPVTILRSVYAGRDASFVAGK